MKPAGVQKFWQKVWVRVFVALVAADAGLLLGIRLYRVGAVRFTERNGDNIVFTGQDYSASFVLTDCSTSRSWGFEDAYARGAGFDVCVVANREIFLFEDDNRVRWRFDDSGATCFGHECHADTFLNGGENLPDFGEPVPACSVRFSVSEMRVVKDTALWRLRGIVAPCTISSADAS
jgi:hypothetical protein